MDKKFKGNRDENKGFTLIELMIGVAIIGILTTIAYPSYLDYVIRSNRSEGLRELVRIANLEEQYYVDNHAYTTNMTDLGLVGATATSFTTEHGWYVISASLNGGGFILTALAQDTAKGKQKTNDPVCKKLTITDTAKKTPLTGCWDK